MPPKIIQIREKHLSDDRYSIKEVLDTAIDATDSGSRPGSGILSPNAKSPPPSCASKKISEILSQCSDNIEKEQALLKILETQKTWIYGIYNELARVQYQLGKTKGCLESISEAKKLIDASKSDANSINKSFVYYNYSQFTSALCLGNKQKQQEALDSIEKALTLISRQTEPDYYQDYIVHKAYILPSLGKHQLSKDLYLDSFKLNPERFVNEFTLDGTGRELIFWAIDNNNTEVLTQLYTLKASIKCPNITPDVSRDTGASALLAATYEGNQNIVAKLLELGANPLYKGDASDTYPIIAALSDGKMDIADLMIKRLDVTDLKVQHDFIENVHEFTEDHHTDDIANTDITKFLALTSQIYEDQ